MRFNALIRYLKSSLWFRPFLYCLIALFALAACFWAQNIGFNYARPEIDTETVTTLLSIISASMLTVTTFAVGSMVSAYSSASSSGTPRAFYLVIADSTSQNAASSFIGAFIFSVIGLIGVKSGIYEASGTFLVFVLTLILFAWVVATFVIWTDKIARLGQVTFSIEKSEQEVTKTLSRLTSDPLMGAKQLNDDKINGAEIMAPEFGYVTEIHMGKLNDAAQSAEADLVLLVRRGDLVSPHKPIAILRNAQADEELTQQIQGAFTIATERAFDDDAGFPLSVMGEIAAKALSPGINDPGTALTIINSLTRSLSSWRKENAANKDDYEPSYENIYVAPVKFEYLVRQGFDLIIRYGADDADVKSRLETALAYLVSIAPQSEKGAIEAYARQIAVKA